MNPPEPAAKKKADTFCPAPFQMLNVMSPGTAKPCCAFAGQVDKDGKAMSLYQHPLEEIWNSDAMRRLRRALDNGEKPAECGYCFRQEELGFQSMRLKLRAAEAKGYSFDDLREKTAVAGYQAPLPSALDLDVGNLCNLKCRMCHSQSSSAIAADPVHSRWAPAGIGAARWRDGEAVIAPTPVLGVEYEGIGWPERRGETLTGWMGREAVVRVDAAETAISGVSIKLSGEKPDGHPFRLTANDETLFDGPLPSGPWSAEFDLAAVTRTPRLELRLRTDAFVRANGTGGGVGIEEIRLRQKSARPKTVFFSRFAAGEEWFREKDLVYGELLSDPDRLECLHMIGGEPQLIKEVREAMRHLVERGAAAKIALAMTTNATFVSEEWLELAKKFKSVIVAVSVDGYAELQEYVRFPAKWGDLEKNLPRLRALPNADVYLHMTVQAYNMLHVAELARHCDEIGIELRHHVLEAPAHLGMLAMPPKVRLEAARRLRAYASASRGRNKDSFADVVAALESAAGEDPKLIEEFMVFTNDMDASRGQDMAAAIPALRELILASGFEWTPRRRFA